MKKKFNFMKYFEAYRILTASIIALTIVFLIIVSFSEQPGLAISKLIFGPLETKRSFFNVIERAIPLIFCGLSLSIILKTGIFSIAADGSFYIGAVIATAIACKIPMPTGVHQIVIILAASIAGGLISMIPVWLNKITKIDPCVLSIMFNSIFYFSGYSVVSSYLLAKTGQWGSEYFPSTATFGKMIPGTNLHWGFVILIAIYIFVVILMEKTSFGYKIKLIGSNKKFAETSGINTSKVILFAALISGAIAGMGGAIEITGMYKRFQWQSPVNYIWDGLMIYMLSGQNPKYIPVASFFIAYLRIGSEIMSRATDLDNEIVAFLQCIIILLVASERFMYFIKNRHDKKVALEQADIAV